MGQAWGIFKGINEESDGWLPLHLLLVKATSLNTNFPDWSPPPSPPPAGDNWLSPSVRGITGEEIFV
ncbi:MAG: hypothetical protein DPW20_03955 [Candidatus Brocadia sp.]|nr:MAG: hypothetical protein UZ01_01750 [Candidatus Brocadia sinica]MBL1167534.1 hypothetical protein [Candidatus Brocadia sp. AMX1]MCQ3916531.1 hypothetical protein [Candidatus Brocadia sp.]RIJ92398.1 MAG: hypothetical protein DB853_04920 [Candidatus Brocadia sp.]